MEKMQEARMAEKSLREAMEKDANCNRITVEQRVAHVHNLQYKEGVEIFAVQCETIQQAAIADNISSLRSFIDDGEIDSQDVLGNTAVHKAVERGCKNALEELHKHHANMEVQNEQGWTPAHVAVNVGRGDMLEMLFEMHARLDIRDMSGATPAHYAAQKNAVDLLQVLYTNQELPLTNDCLDIPANNGCRPSHLAAQHDALEALDFLYRHDVDLGQRDKFGEAPAHKAARGQHIKTMKGLRKIKMDFGQCNFEEDSPADLEADRSRFWTEGAESVMSLRELAKLKRDGKINHEEFARLRNRAIAAAEET
mmetsp:Transcript_18231/g.48132  ORF Transcript_18231/g.48132 Transcript_18231/m.48132 type:complete len:310 (-) Transcript_18231:27-956(-)